MKARRPRFFPMPTTQPMSNDNGNRKAILSIRDSIRAGRSVDKDARDDVLFTAIIDIYDQLAKFDPVLTFYKIGVYFAGALGISILGLLWGLLTGQVEITIK